ncbi:MAG: type VI secretion system baseplate subunit TssE [Orrella sp.]
MAQACLLDRLLYIANPRAIAGMSPELVGQQSIMRHLTLLLNTRKGSVPIDPDYGLSDMNNIAGSFSSGTSEDICLEIIQQINRYEPRLLNPKISSVTEGNDIISLKYELNAHIIGSQVVAANDSFSMYLRINSAGRVRLEPRRDR